MGVSVNESAIIIIMKGYPDGDSFGPVGHKIFWYIIAPIWFLGVIYLLFS